MRKINTKRKRAKRPNISTIRTDDARKENLEELREILIEMVRERHFKIYPNWSIEQNVNLDWQE